MSRKPIATTRSRRSTLGILASGLVLAAACSGSRAEAPTTTDAPSTTATEPTTTEEATTTSRATTTARPTTTTEHKRRWVRPEPARMPLTGVPLAGEPPPRRPALVVKIDNVDEARPQTGLNQADIVFEEIVEGRLTRFAAVFHSQGSNPVGPIRSGRTQDVDLLSGLNRPLFAWSGGNPGVTAAIDNSDFVSLNACCSGGYFRTDRPTPHNLYNNTDTLWAQATPEAGHPRPMFRYILPGEDVRGQVKSWMEVQVGISSVRWEFSPQCICYLRSQYGSAHELTDGQATTDNVVVLVTGYRPSYVDARSPEAITVARGKAFVMSRGHLQIGTWERKFNTDPVRLFRKNGRLMEIGPGRTWVELADVIDHDTRFG
jgi:Protein of unknown function (DUF3048) N-terminal domain/Protein of unknown function (DUF3048) C-terminal domain